MEIAWSLDLLSRGRGAMWVWRRRRMEEGGEGKAEKSESDGGVRRSRSIDREEEVE